MPLDLTGTARLNKIVVDRTGAGSEDQQTKVDYKLSMVVGNGVLAYFDPGLKSALFNPESSGPRFGNMAAVKWKGTQRNVDMKMERVQFTGVTLHGFSFEPMENDRVLLKFTAATYPTGKQVADTTDLLKNTVEIAIGDGQLNLDGIGPHKASAPPPDKPNLAPLEKALDAAETVLTKTWPLPDKDGLYPSPSEILQHRDETLHVMCWAKIKLLQIGPDAWVVAPDFELPDDAEPTLTPLDYHCKRLPSRGAGVLQGSAHIIRACEAWEQQNKRSPAAKRQAVTALKKWAAGLPVGGAPASVNEPPPKPTKKASKKP